MGTSGPAIAGLALWVAGLALVLSLTSLAWYECRSAGTGLAGCTRWLSQRGVAMALCAAAAAVAVGAALSARL